MRAGKRIAAVLVVLLACYVVWQYVSIWNYGKTVHPVKSDVIIVLGAEVRGVTPSPALAERCDWAYEMYEQGYAPKLILSGAQGSAQITEAEAMRRYLAAKGVPENAMLLEGESHTTRENLENSKKIMDKEHMKTALIVTHLFHQKRAQLLASQVGIQATGFGEHSQAMFEPYWMLRETAAIVKTYMGD